MSKLQNNWKLIFLEEKKILREGAALENGSDTVLFFGCYVPSQCCTFLGVLENHKSTRR